MPVFKDANGREWQIKLDAPKIMEVRKACEIDLGALDASIFSTLEGDPVKLVDVLWVLCRGQVEGVTDTDFGQSLVGDPIETATKALYDAYCDFFPTRKRLLLRSLAEKQAALTDKAMAQLMAQLNDPAMETQLLEASKAKMQRELENLLTSLNGPTNSPESAELDRRIDLPGVVHHGNRAAKGDAFARLSASNDRLAVARKGIRRSGVYRERKPRGTKVSADESRAEGERG